MAKQSIIQAIRAKPNARGKTSHLPEQCSVKGCTNDSLVNRGPFNKRIKACEPHYKNPPQSKAKSNQVAKLRSMGLLP